MKNHIVSSLKYLLKLAILLAAIYGAMYATGTLGITTEELLGTKGVVLAVAVVVAQQLLDRRIKTEEDLARIANVPVLGVIPHFHSELKPAYPSFGTDKKKKAAR